MAETTKRIDLSVLLQTYLTVYDAYHTQKELMAYGTVVLYLGAAWALFAQKAFWLSYSCWQIAVLLMLIVSFTTVAFAFIRQQLHLAIDAGLIFEACSNVAALWATKLPEDLPQPCRFKSANRNFDEFDWPQPIAESVDNLRRTKPEPLHTARVTCYCAVLIWGLAACVRVLLTYQHLWPSE